MTYHVIFPPAADPFDLDTAESVRVMNFAQEAGPLLPAPVSWTDEAFPPYAVFDSPSDAVTRKLRALAEKHDGRMRKGEPRGIRYGWA